MEFLLTPWLKFATAGPTIDGREILEAWLKGMAKTYSLDLYPSGVNWEHFGGYGLGTVHEVKLGKDPEGRLALYGRVDPTGELVELVRSGKKPFFSIEVREGFPTEKDFYLGGVAATSSPASQGLKPAKFSTCGENAMVFSGTEAMEIGEDFTPVEAEDPTPAKTEFTAEDHALFSKMGAWFQKTFGANHTNQEDEPMTNEEREAFEALQGQVKTLNETIKGLVENLNSQAGDGNQAKEIQAKVEETQADFTAEIGTVNETLANVQKSLEGIQPVVDKFTAFMAEPNNPTQPLEATKGTDQKNDYGGI